MVRRLLRLLLLTLAVLMVLVIAGGLYARYRVRASLPPTDGRRVVSGLGAPVTIERDALGVPTITATGSPTPGDPKGSPPHGSAQQCREDAIQGLGFLHAQDRFFQMDLQRRQAAGELAALVGPRAIEADRQARVHRMRHVARRAFERTDPSYRRVLEAYAKGVNAGLAALAAPPFEYLLLRATPEPWHSEDSILTLLAMFNTLQGRQSFFEQTMSALRDTLPEPMFRFLAAAGSEWDTPVVGSALVRPPIPGPEVFDLRKMHVRATEAQRHRDSLLDSNSGIQKELCLLCDSVSLWPVRDADEASIIGSNNWAVDGAHTASGVALVANDMHLSLGVPIIWYRASLAYPDPLQPETMLRITGITLPGLPLIVAGSNGHVAWGFTNSGGDWSDLVRIERDTHDGAKYLTPDGPKPFAVFSETIAAKGGEPITIPVRWTIWGPIVWKDARGTEYAQRWVAHDPDVLSSDITMLDRARSVDDVLSGSAGLGIPNQNIAIGDETGRIAWTIAGVIPRRVGGDGLTPGSWARGAYRWDGYLPAEEFPRIVDPGEGRIWTANAPVVDGAMLATIGDGGYADGIRARLIRDRLMKIDKATPRDMLDVQLENSALFLERWRTLLLATLSTDAARGLPLSTGGDRGLPPSTGGGRGLQPSPLRADFRRLVESTWTGRASPDSVAYRLVRTFRTTFVRQVMTTLTEPATKVDLSFDYTRSFRGEGPVWQLILEKPAHLLDPKYASWDEWMLAAVDVSIDELTAGGRTLAERTWGEANRAQMFHPLSAGIPWFGRWLNMPADALPGDVYAPRAHSPRAGPSERMVVSPGRESEGIMEIPTGQSGHPLSPHYRDQYRAWLKGEPTPFLPGPTVSTLTLTPQ